MKRANATKLHFAKQVFRLILKLICGNLEGLLSRLIYISIRKIGPFHGRRSQNPNGIRKIGPFYGQDWCKAGIANDKQIVQWTFAVSGSPSAEQRRLL